MQSAGRRTKLSRCSFAFLRWLNCVPGEQFRNRLCGHLRRTHTAVLHAASLNLPFPLCHYGEPCTSHETSGYSPLDRSRSNLDTPATPPTAARPSRPYLYLSGRYLVANLVTRSSL